MPETAVLAAFSRDWVGGDIRGLQEVAERLYCYLPHVQGLVGRLSVTARNLCDDGPGGWHGAAADAFTEAWSRQTTIARALEEYVTAVAKAIDSLAVELSQIQAALENEAYLVARDGVHIGGNGTVIGYAGPIGLQTALEYRKVFQQAQAEADQARNAAAEQLNGLYQQVFNPNPHLNGADANPGAAMLADLMATPTANRRGLMSDIKKLKGQDLNFEEAIAEAKRSGELLPREVFDKSDKVGELEEVKQELAQSDVQDGQDVGSALGDEIISNTLETGSGAVVGAELGGRLGAEGGPLGIAAGTAAGYIVGDLSHDLLTEPWGQDIHAHGVAGGILYGTGHSEFEVGDDARELGVAGGHAVEHLWDDAIGWC